MAVKDSGEIATNSNYTLGDYSFRIERSSVPGSTNDKIEAICTKGGKNARKSIQVPSSTKFDAWYVEANETEASVYVLIQGAGDGYVSGLNTKTWTQPIKAAKGAVFTGDGVITNATVTSGNASILQSANKSGFIITGEAGSVIHIVKDYSNTGIHREYDVTLSSSLANTSSYTHDGKTAYWHHEDTLVYYGTANPSDLPQGGGTWVSNGWGEAGWTITYGIPTTKYPKEMLIARFPIEIDDAGGVGPRGGIGGGWTDPEDYDEDWEEGDPTHTLYVEVTGALSGRHNDPIVDPSFSYIPADKDTVKDYGCGGDGGHGGGGGAGASTVVIHKFATNQANSKEVTALARRHGYGSGGGKGGKGGDGCILVYY